VVAALADRERNGRPSADARLAPLASRSQTRSESLTGGGPVNATQTLATQVWQQTFVYGRFGYGSALALILAGLVATLSIAQVSLLRYQETRL
jgi:hypothetical protein